MTGRLRVGLSREGRGGWAAKTKSEWLAGYTDRKAPQIRWCVAHVHVCMRKAGWCTDEIDIHLNERSFMDRGGRSTLSSFQRVQEFLTQNTLADAPAGMGAQAAELGDVIARLTSESVGQEAGSRFVRVHAESQRTLREALLKEHMQPVSRVAREVFGATGMDKAFHMPRLVKANQPVLAAAGAMAEAAEKSKEVFLTHGLGPDFIEQLKSAAQALDTARNARAESARRRVTATAAVQDQLKRGRRAVRLLLAILAPRLAKDPELNAAWESAKRARSSGVGAVVADAAVEVQESVPVAQPEVKAA